MDDADTDPNDREAIDLAPERPSPIDASESGLVSRDYRPRTPGPELVTSWPLGPAPTADSLDETDWQIETADYVSLQRVRLSLPYLGGHDFAPLYLNVVGHVTVETDATLSLWLTQRHLDGEHYELNVDLARTGNFQTPMIEVAPDDPEAIEQGREVYGGFTLRARVEDGSATVGSGTAVQLFTE